ncbi:MAG: transglutaminase domain-containing protein [Desulfobacterales bacterium]|nr:transglutaminase domain-containing protein [Desulfobacterales bacterium]
MKKIISTILLLFLSGSIYAENIITFYSAWVNPVYSHLSVSARNSAVKSDTDECFTYDGLKSLINSNFSERNSQFRIILRYSFPDFSQKEVSGFINNAISEVLAEDDYLHYNIIGFIHDASGVNGNIVIEIDAEYHTTLSQEQYVSYRITEISNEIIKPNMNDEQKEKAIHDWVVSNVDYDTDKKSSSHSAWAALKDKAVCQGYTLLTHRLLIHSGIKTKIIIGILGNEAHSWNMVYICGNWYHLDTTADDPVYTKYIRKFSEETAVKK